MRDRESRRQARRTRYRRVSCHDQGRSVRGHLSCDSPQLLLGNARRVRDSRRLEARQHVFSKRLEALRSFLNELGVDPILVNQQEGEPES